MSYRALAPAVIVLAACGSGEPRAVSAPVASAEAPSSTPPVTDAAASPPPSASSASAAPGDESAPSPDRNYLTITTLRAGTGRGAVKGDTLRVHYVGTLLDDGTEFDSSRKAGRQPFTFELGRGTVIRGWEEGLVGMQVGELRKLVIRPEWAYGHLGRPPVIPPKSALVFEVELLGFGP
jgi:FKBP-type peptidyl-prolyl cis-trans isomerase